MPRIVKDCFGTVISTLNKMKECVRCELLAECRSINWAASEGEPPPVIVRRTPHAPHDPSGEAADGDGHGAGAPR